MRKALIAVIVASALFAVGALAANFTVNSEDVASGSDGVTACADSVDVDFDTDYDGTSDWDVGSALITFYDGTTPAATTDCASFGATLAVELDGGGQQLAEATVPTGSSTVTITLTPALKANDIVAASVLVDGKELNVDTPGGGL
ncbi:MAG TPA: hypothetical protein VFU14_11995 [Acidimicrobiales bacterium]|nr:hypothetical protein [Acidimicrobiales bacterium]